MKNKNSAAILSFFLGGVGVHKFYLGEIGWGIVYAIFFWTYIPTLAGLVEALLLFSMSPRDFNLKYNRRAFLGHESRLITNEQGQTIQVIVNVDGEPATLNAPPPPPRPSLHKSPAKPKNPAIATESIDRRILELCMAKGEVTLLDCFLAMDDVSRSVLEERLEDLVRLDFLQIGNRSGDGKVVYRHGQGEVNSAEKTDRQILKLCQRQGEVTLLDCFLEIENTPMNVLEGRLESLVSSGFLEIGNRTEDGKVVYRLDN